MSNKVRLVSLLTISGATGTLVGAICIVKRLVIAARYRRERRELVALVRERVGVMSPFPVESHSAMELRYKPDADEHTRVSLDLADDLQFLCHVLESAQRRVLMAIYSFSAPVFVHLLASLAKRGVDVRVIIDGRMGSGREEISWMRKHGVRVMLKSASPPCMHLKMIIIDDHILAAGSMNLSRGSLTRSEDGFLFFCDRKMVKEALGQFYHLWDRFAEDRKRMIIEALRA